MRRRLLILVVWLLGVAGLWWLLPVTPRTSFVVPGRLVGVSDAGVVVAFGDVAAGDDSPEIGPVTAWDAATGRQLWAVYGPTDRVTAELTEDGRRVAVRVGELASDLENWAELRDTTTGSVVARYPGLVEFSRPDGRWAMTYESHPPGGDVRLNVRDLWETATGRWVRRLDATAIWFSPDGCKLLSLSRHSPDRDEWAVYDTVTGRLIDRPDIRQQAWWMSDGHLIREDGLAWDVDTHRATGRFQVLTGLTMSDSLPRPDGPWRIEFDRSPGVGFPLPSTVGWRLADGRWRRVSVPSGHCLKSWWVTADGRAVVLVDARFRIAGPVGKWLARRHSALARFGEDDTDDTFVVLDADTAVTLARLPPCREIRLSADRRTLFTVDYPDDNDRTRVTVWDLPLQAGRRLIALLAVGWAVVLVIPYRWLGRKRTAASPSRP